MPRTATQDERADAVAILPVHLRPPRRAIGLLHREELLNRISAAVTSCQLVVVSAASGFGKTTLLGDLYRRLAERGVACLWVAITENGGDAAWLARILVEQLARRLKLDPKPNEDFAALASRSPDDQPVIVIIDNWNFIESEATNRLFDRLAVEADGLATFVIASRTVPGFQIQHKRLAGDYASFDARDLAFTMAEAGAVLGSPASLTKSVLGLIQRTEGWPAGVQLLRLALEQAREGDAPLADFTGSRSDVADYLSQAFFRRLAADQRAFLCNIAVLDELSGDLVSAALDEPNAGEQFAEVVRDNLFLTDIGDQPARYRFHSLFRDFLLSQHAREATVSEHEALDRAVRWHRARGELAPAIAYALRAQDDEVAVAMLGEFATSRLVGEGKIFQFAAWVDGLIARDVSLDPVVQHWYCWTLVFTGRWRDALTQYRRSEDGDVEIAAVIASFADDQPEARRALDAWRQAGEPGSAFTQAVMHCATAVTAMAYGHVDVAVEAAHRARLATERGETAYGRVWVEIVSALAFLMKGRADVAEGRLREGLRIAETMLGPEAPVCRTARLMAAVIAWERCADEQAGHDLAAADRSADEHSLPIIIVAARAVAEALGKEWRGQRSESALASPAMMLVAKVMRLDARWRSAPSPADGNDDESDVFAIALADAKARDPELLASGWMLRDLLARSEARRRLSAGDTEAALHLVNPAINACRRRGRDLAAQHLQLLKVAALLQENREAVALRLLIQTAEEAVRGGTLRAFESERSLIAPLLPALLEAGRRAPLGDPEAWRHFAERLRLGGEAVSPPTHERSVDIDPITDREREMLGFLDLGLSNQEIGERLGISVPTVKWHLHNLFSKIMVRNRSSAVHFAREHGLL